jgi:muramoyltetrapeptide carboxypeptidase
VVGVSSSPARDPSAEADWLRPPALKPGDTIAFVAPSGPAEMPPLRRYAEILEAAGYKVLVPEGIVRDGKRSDDERAAKLNAMIRDPKVRAIFPARGGYGLTRIVDRIDYAALRKDPKIVTGFSDLTALHLAIARKARHVSFHAPMPMSHLAQGDRPEFAFEAASFRRAVFADQYGKGASGYTIAYPADGKPETLVGGVARGRLLGGNLSLVAATMGTPFAIEPEGAILVLEDTNEPPYHVDRYLSQLRLAGVLGDFGGKDPAEVAEIEGVLRDYFAKAKVPVLWRFPVGHTPRNATLPHGGLVELDADRGSLRLLEDPVRRD